MKEKYTLKMGRFYKDNRILQHEEVLKILNKIDQLELDKEKYLENYLSHIKEEYGVNNNRKRFQLEKNSDHLLDTNSGKRYMYAKEVKTVLNRLHEKNRRLIDIIDRLRLDKEE